MSRLLYLGLLFVVCCAAATSEGDDVEVETNTYDTVSTSNIESEYEAAESEKTEEDLTDESSESVQSISETNDVEELDSETSQKSSKKIIPISGCKKCPPNEIFLLKKKSCPPDSCVSLVARYDCSNAPPPKPGCTCKSGYKRLNGKCVPICKCPQVASLPQCKPKPVCNGPNEEFVQEKSTCPGDTCRSLVIRVDCSNAPPPQPGCTCKSGFFRKFNETSPCVPICECPEMASSAQCAPPVTTPKPSSCGLKEVEVCAYRCPPERTCANRNIAYRCARDDRPCQKKCVCEPGYYRNSIGQCITKAQCEQCSKPHEFFSCGSACDNECSTIQYQNRTNCPIINIKCNEKCYCEDGYARDDNGNCIPVQDCKICGINEIEVKLCPLCPPDAPDCASKTCERKCICKNGYKRNDKGICVVQCNKPHEFFDCGPECDNECKTLGIQNRTNCPIINKKCNEKCYCEDGYARDDKGNCIPVDKCHKPKCGLNEEVVCSTGCPPEKTCENRKEEYACPAVVLPCENVCQCKNGYFRNDKGVCVREAQCDRPKCGVNEEAVESCFRCPPGRFCAAVVRPCKIICQCKPGYSRNKKGICQIKYPPTCADVNEEYVLSKTCPPDECAALVTRYICDPTEVAQFRCRCKSGYLRPEAGLPCIPINQCPQMGK